MNLFILLTISALVFCIIHFLVLPRIELKESDLSSVELYTRNSMLALLGTIKMASFVFSIVSLIIILLMKILRGSDVDSLNNAISNATIWRDNLQGFGTTWGIVSTVILSIGLILYNRARGKVKIERIVDRLWNEGFNRTAKAYEKGELEELEPNQLMGDIASELQKIAVVEENLDEFVKENDLDKQEFIEQLEESKNQLEEHLIIEDVRRRVKIDFDPEEVALPIPSTLWEKIQVFFYSRGLLQNLGRGSRAIYMLILILIIPSLLGIASSATTDGFNNRIAQLNHLRINMELPEAKEQMNQEIESLGPEQKEELTAEEIEVIDEIVAIYESEMMESIMESTNLTRANRSVMRRNIVRDQILSKFEERVADVQKLKSGSEAFRSGEVASELFAQSEEALRNGIAIDRPSIIREKLVEAVKRKPSLIDKLKSEIKQFQVTVKRKDITHALAKQMLSMSVQEMVPNTQLEELLSRAINDTEGVKIHKAVEKSDALFVRDIVGDVPFTEIINRAKSNVQGDRFKSMFKSYQKDIIPERINIFPAAITSSSRDVSEASLRISKFAANRGQGAIELADALSGFTDWFSPQLGVEANTPRAKLMAKINPHVAKAVANASRNLNRSRSFVKLRGFSRVGGVLIGRNPVLTMHRYVDLEWSMSDNTIQFTLIDENGEHHQSLPINASIAWYALNYAADGRPVAVTMVTAPPMVELKILTHPALIDNPMGARMIEIDRFVDRYTVKLPERAIASSKVASQNNLYKIAWAIRFSSMLNQFDDSEIEIQPWKNAMNEIITSKELKESAEICLRSINEISDKSLSPLKVKAEFYDQSLVSDIIEAGRKSSSIERFIISLQSDFNRMDVSDYTESKRIDISTPPPTYQEWSGVREKGYSLAPKDILMMKESDPTPLEFMLQVAFTSEPIFYSGNVDEYTDENPWDFPSIGEKIQEEVENGISMDSEHVIILDDVTEFVYAQRLFRSIFDGHLGADFPVERLYNLSQDLEHVPLDTFQTLRWNVRRSNEPMKNIIEKLEEDYSKEELQKLLEIKSDLKIMDKDFIVMLRFYSRVSNTDELNELMSIREKLGINEDQKLAAENRPLPIID